MNVKAVAGAAVEAEASRLCGGFDVTDPFLTEQLILKRVRSLPSMSTVISEISALVSNDWATADDFEKVIRKDAGLTAALLKLANSAAFGLQGRITSVSHAASFLGVNRMLDLAICASFSKVIPKTLPGYGIRARDFWRHNAATAVLCERLAKQLGIAVTTEAFTCGLLHDCGKLVIAQLVRGRERALALEHSLRQGADMTHAERDLLGMDHAEVGQKVVEIWNLPRAIADSARWHHSPAEAPEDTDRRMIGMVHIASTLTYSLLPEHGGQRELSTQTCQELGLDSNTLQQIVSQAEPQIRELSELA